MLYLYICLTILFKIKTIFQWEVCILDVLACNHSIFYVFFNWFATDTQWHFEMCFKMLSGVCSKLIEKYNGNIPCLVHSHHSTAFEMDFSCLYRNRFQWVMIHVHLFIHCAFNSTGLFYVWKFLKSDFPK